MQTRTKQYLTIGGVLAFIAAFGLGQRIINLLATDTKVLVTKDKLADVVKPLEKQLESLQDDALYIRNRVDLIIDRLPARQAVRPPLINDAPEYLTGPAGTK